MKEVYLIRHAEKDPDGILTPEGEEAAKTLRGTIPAFARVVSSNSSRTQKTAELLTGRKPEVDDRAGFSMSTQQKSDDINHLASENNITFLEAAIKYNDSEVLSGIDAKARELKELVTELLTGLEDGQKALVVSHDLSISPEVALDGVPLSSIDFLHGYVIRPNEIPQPTDLRSPV
jgi:broad specificity phosphatase PhoE